MYKDVGKRILAVMLCICMLVGMGHVSNLTVRAEDSLMLTLSTYSATYTGQPVAPTVTVQAGGVTLAEGTDYVIEVSNEAGTKIDLNAMVDVGTYKIVAKGSGAYVNHRPDEMNFSIVARSLAGMIQSGKITVNVPAELEVGSTFDGTMIILTDLDSGTTLTGISETDYRSWISSTNPTEKQQAEECDYTWSITGDINMVGNIGVTVTGRNNYGTPPQSGPNSATYQIRVKPKPFDDITYTNRMYYDGTSKIPTDIVVKSGGVPLAKDQDYTITYYDKNNRPVSEANIVRAGEYYFTVTGRGAYLGSTSTPQLFTVVKKIDQYASEIQVTINGGRPLTYNGQAQTPEVTVLDNGVRLVAGTDYTLTFQNNTEASTNASVVIRGTGVYEGNLPQQFTINPISLKGAGFRVNIPPVTYNAEAQMPEYTATLNGQDITEIVKANCTATYTDEQGTGFAQNAGVAKMTLTPNPGTGNFVDGPLEVTFTIAKKSVQDSDIKVALEYDSYDYTGSEIRPNITVSYETGTRTEVLALNTDYTVQYGSAIGATNQATLYVEGVGNYNGLRPVTYTINPRMLNESNTTITVNGEYTYTGSGIRPDVTVTYQSPTGPIELVNGRDFVVSRTPNGDNVNASVNARVEIDGLGNYTGNVGTIFEIKKKNIADPTAILVTLPQPSMEFTGEELKAPVIVQYRVGMDMLQLTEGKDFFISYKDNTHVAYDGDGKVIAQATVQIQGTQNFFGTIEKTFTITPKTLNLNELRVTATDRNGDEKEFKDFVLPYWGKEVLPESSDYDYTFNLEYTIGGNKWSLVKTTDYEISYENNDRIGTAQMVVTGKGDYAGSVSIDFYIKGSIADDWETIAGTKQVVVEIKDKEYTGANVRLSKDDITITYKRKHTNADGGESFVSQELEASDYDFVYVDDAGNDIPGYTNVGTGKIKITATMAGNFTGDRVAEFNIVPKELNETDFKVTIPDQTYRGTAFTEDEIAAITTVMYLNETGGLLVDAADYDLTFDDADVTNCNPQVNITITAKDTADNYVGSMKATFAIVERELTRAEVTEVINGGEKLVLVEQPEILITEDMVRLSYQSADGTITMEDVADGGLLTYDIIPADGGYKAVGETSLIVRGTGNFKGDVEIPITIYGDLKAGYEPETVYIDDNGEEKPVLEYIYDPEPFFTESVIEPEVTVMYRGKELTLDEDFETVYSGETTNVTLDGKNPWITIRGAGNYEPVKEEAFKVPYWIRPCDLQKAYEAGTLRLVFEEVTYNKKEQTPLREMYNGSVDGSGGTKIADSVDGKTWTFTTSGNSEFTIEYENNINGFDPNFWDEEQLAGMQPPTVIITPKEGVTNYKGSLRAYFTIMGVSFDKYDVTIDPIEDYTYTGEVFTPELNITVSDKPGSSVPDVGQSVVLEKDKDYVVSYMNAMNAGAARNPDAPADTEPYVLITGINNFAGKLKKGFTILPRNIDPQVNPISVTVEDADYTGATITPNVKIIDNGRKDDGVMPESIYLTQSLFTGAENSVELVQDTDFRLSVPWGGNITAGKEAGTVTIEGTGNYTGTVERKFSIIPRAMDDGYVIVKMPTQPQIYQATQIKPVPTVYAGSETPGNLLRMDVDYTVSYGANLNVGTNAGTLTISSISPNLVGSLTVEFDIEPKDLAQGEAEGTIQFTISDAAYKPDGAVPEITVTHMNGTTPVTLTEGVDYEVEYSNNQDIGQGTVRFTGIGNYTGEVTKNFNILMNIDLAEAEPIEPQDYTGQAIEPVLKLTMNNVPLTLGVDYTLEYRDNVEAGVGTIIVTGIGAYRGTKVVTFEIGRDFSEVVEVVGLSENHLYTGKAVEPKIGKVTLGEGGMVLTKDVDYTLSYANNVNVGTATITVTGTGIYRGSRSFEFQIIRRSVAQCQANITAKVTYDGRNQTPAVTVKYGDISLKNGTDYSVVYLNNEKPGTARVIINGRGNYTGNKVLNFDINVNPMSGVKGIANSGKKITLSWNQVSGVTGYEIYDSNNTRIGRISGTSYSIVGLNPGTSYTYRIRTYVTKGGQAFFSPFTSVTVKTN